MIDDFQAANPNIEVKLLSGPYASTQDQTFTAAASGTMADVVGLDGAWVSDLHKQGALADLSGQMKDAATTSRSSPARCKLDGSTYMIPVVNFVYPLFVNDDLMKKAGVTKTPEHPDRVQGRGRQGQQAEPHDQGLDHPALAPRTRTASRTT